MPRPTSLSTTTSPPDCRTNPKTMLRPRPLPAPKGLVVKNGSKIRARISGGMPAPVSLTLIRTWSPGGTPPGAGRCSWLV